jgi:uncharacterized protein
VRLRRLAIGSLVAIALLYSAMLVALYGFQRRLIYPGWWRGTAAVTPDLAGYRDIAVTTADGLRGRLLYHPPRDGKPVVLFFHGNGDSVMGSVVSVEALVAAGYGAVLPEYRGYNGNPGEPDESGLYADARAARSWMAANGIVPDRTIVIGYSIGTGIAAQMALEMRPRALVLVAPYASLPHVIAAHFPWIPAELLARDRLDTAAKIARIGCPVLLIHGDRDATIPAAESAVLKAARPDATRIVFPGVGHEVVFTAPAQASIATWLKGLGL